MSVTKRQAPTPTSVISLRIAGILALFFLLGSRMQMSSTMAQDLPPESPEDTSEYFVFQSQQAMIDAVNTGQSGGEIFAQLQAESKIEIASIDNFSISGSDGTTMPIRFYDPAIQTKPAPLLIYIYGGGGNMDFYDAGLRRFANATGLMVATMDYRLAPFRDSLVDVVATIRWIVQNSEELGVDSERIALGGVSRGANVALSTALILRDSESPKERNLIRVMYLLNGYYSPDVLSSRSMEMFGHGRELLTYEDTERLLDEIYPEETDYSNPLAFPILEESLSHLPPIYIVASGIDPLRDDSIELAARLDAEAQEYYLAIWPGVGHNAGSLLFTPIIPEIETYLDAMAAYLRGVLLEGR